MITADYDLEAVRRADLSSAQPTITLTQVRAFVLKSGMEPGRAAKPVTKFLTDPAARFLPDADLFRGRQISTKTRDRIAILEAAVRRAADAGRSEGLTLAEASAVIDRKPMPQPVMQGWLAAAAPLNHALVCTDKHVRLAPAEIVEALGRRLAASKAARLQAMAADVAAGGSASLATEP